MIILVLSSFLPDIDIQTSKIGSKLKLISFLSNKIFSHRGFFHSLILPGLIYFIFDYIFELKEIGQAVFIGMSSHLFLDMLTIDGIALFAPFYNKRIKGFIRTGGLIENILFFMIFLSVVFLLVIFLDIF